MAKNEEPSTAQILEVPLLFLAVILAAILVLAIVSDAADRAREIATHPIVHIAR